jgi:hypothetical protein
MKKQIRLWLDDVRDPVEFGKTGWVWAKTYDEAVKAFEDFDVIEASLDHDLTYHQTVGYDDGEKTGYSFVCWMEENEIFPVEGVTVHSANPAGGGNMMAGLRAICRRKGIDQDVMVRRRAAPPVTIY